MKFIRDNVELIKKNCQNRHVSVDVDLLIKLDVDRRVALKNIEEKRAARKQKSKGKPTDEEIVQLRQAGDEIASLEKAYAEIEGEYNGLLLKIPNLTHADTPLGGEDDYKVLFSGLKPPTFKFEPKDHEQLLLDLDLIDFDAGAWNL